MGLLFLTRPLGRRPVLLQNSGQIGVRDVSSIQLLQWWLHRSFVLCQNLGELVVRDVVLVWREEGQRG